MIYSDKQYEKSKRLINDLLDAKTLTKRDSNKEEWLRQAETSALEAQISALLHEVEHYQELKRGKIKYSKSNSLQDLPQVLIESRISQGYSQTQLAELLNLKPQQIQRYEATSYMGASLARLNEIAIVLGVQIDGLFELRKAVGNRILSWNMDKEPCWNKLPIEEMLKRKWIMPKSDKSQIALARDYITTMTGCDTLKVHDRKKLRNNSKYNKYNMMAWQARIVDLASQVNSIPDTRHLTNYDSWIHELKDMTIENSGPARAREFLLSKGIILVVESHLPQTHIDGAAMLLKNGSPIIGLTLRLNRIDNFWFTLFHELGHVCLHLKKGVSFDFFDQEETVCNDLLERQADKFAVEHLISEKDWSSCLSPYAASDESVEIDARRLGVHPAIVAGRIRKERENYSILSNIVYRERIGSQLEIEENETA